MKVLLTGGTGLIGQALGQELVRRGHEVVLVTRDIQKAKLHMTYPCEFVLSQEMLPKHLKSVEAIIHLAGESIGHGPWTDKTKNKIIKSRVGLLKDLMDLLHSSEAKQVHTFITASGVGYYGSRGDQWLAEESRPGKDFLSEVCIEWEQALFAGLQKLPHQIRGLAMRTGVVLSHQGGLLPQLLPIFQRGLGGPLGNGKQWMSWVHLQDVVNMYIWSLENKNISGAINAVAPEPVTNAEWTKLLAKKIGRPAFFPVPRQILKIILGEMSQLALDSQRVSSQKIQNLGFHFQYPDLSGALSQLFEGQKPGDEYYFAQQWVPHEKEEVFLFFSDAKNLEKLTPSSFHLHVLSKNTSQIHKGSLINYKLKIKGLPLKWQTHIDHWEPPHCFMDSQRKGPYRRWYHEHHFEDLGGGTLLTDRVTYRLPLGFLGQFAAREYVERDLQKLFSHRRKWIFENYG